jgi:hypothetical protein
MSRMPYRFELRLAPDDWAQLRATSGGLGVTPTKFVRRALRERLALEAALKQNDERSDDGD